MGQTGEKTAGWGEPEWYPFAIPSIRLSKWLQSWNSCRNHPWNRLQNIVTYMMLVTQFLGVSKIQQSKVLSTMGDSHWTILIHLNLKKIKLNLLNVTMENAFLFLLSLRNKIILQHFFLLNVILGWCLLHWKEPQNGILIFCFNLMCSHYYCSFWKRPSKCLFLSTNTNLKFRARST